MGLKFFFLLSFSFFSTNTASNYCVESLVLFNLGNSETYTLRIKTFFTSLITEEDNLIKDTKEQILRWPLSNEEQESLLQKMSLSRDFSLKIAKSQKMLNSLISQPEEFKKRLNAIYKSWDAYFSIPRIPKTSTELDSIKADLFSKINEYKHMDDLEKQFDVLARKTALSNDNSQLHEVDQAFATRRIPSRRATISNNGDIKFSDIKNSEIVYSIGHRGAINFSGTLSSSSNGNRYYAVILPKEFISRNSSDLTSLNISREEFINHHLPQGKGFYIQRENSTREQGQLHIHLGRDWSFFSFNEKILRLQQFINHHILTIVEFDETGKILEIRGPLHD